MVIALRVVQISMVIALRVVPISKAFARLSAYTARLSGRGLDSDLGAYYIHCKGLVHTYQSILQIDVLWRAITPISIACVL